MQLTASMAHAEATLQESVSKAVQEGHETVHQHTAMLKMQAPNFHQTQAQLQALCLASYQISIARDKENLESEKVEMSIQESKATSASLSIDLADQKSRETQVSLVLATKTSDNKTALAKRQKIIAELERSVDCYKRLGLSMQKDGEQLLLTFTMIDSRDHHRKFEFVLHITDDDSFQMSLCVPPVAQAKALLRTLNKDSNFAKFVQNMRREFQQVVEREKVCTSDSCGAVAGP